MIAMHRAYHGRTFGALAATSEAKYRDPFTPMLPGFRHIPFDDLDALDAAMDGTVAAVIVEPIQGEAGVRVPADGYLAGVRERCTAGGALLILDEIQTAFRTGAPFAFSATAADPDILCLSKGIANGLPMGVTVTTKAVGERIPKGSHGSTFAGNPLVCAAGAATLRVLADPELHLRAQRLGAAFLERLRALQRPEIREVRGRGLMVALELKRPATALIKALQDRGVLTLPAGATGIRFLPSVLIDERQLEVATDVLAVAIADGGDLRHL
jgi:acetylornithine/LysW-gamma-L-lysine aminotransferase